MSENWATTGDVHRLSKRVAELEKRNEIHAGYITRAELHAIQRQLRDATRIRAKFDELIAQQEKTNDYLAGIYRSRNLDDIEKFIESALGERDDELE